MFLLQNIFEQLIHIYCNLFAREAGINSFMV